MNSAAVTESVSRPTRERKPMNGVDVPSLFATINVVRENTALAKFQFRATNHWIKGTHSRSRIESFSGAGGEHQHVSEFSFDGDHPAVLCGADNGPTPVEFLLHALASCLTAGIGNIAAARGVQLTEVRSEITGDIDLQGLLGLSDDVRPGYQGLAIRFHVTGDAPAEKLREIVEQSRRRSAVYDVLTRGVPVRIDVDAG